MYTRNKYEIVLLARLRKRTPDVLPEKWQKIFFSDIKILYGKSVRSPPTSSSSPFSPVDLQMSSPSEVATKGLNRLIAGPNVLPNAAGGAHPYRRMRYALSKMAAISSMLLLKRAGTREGRYVDRSFLVKC